MDRRSFLSKLLLAPLAVAVAKVLPNFRRKRTRAEKDAQLMALYGGEINPSLYTKRYIELTYMQQTNLGHCDFTKAEAQSFYFGEA